MPDPLANAMLSIHSSPIGVLGTRDTGGMSVYVRALAREMVAQQEAGRPVHEWPLARFESAPAEQDSIRTIGQIMTSDVFTVHPEDLVDLAASLMEWEHLRYVPVEDREGRLVGLLSHRQLLRLTTRGGADKQHRTDNATRQTESLTAERAELAVRAAGRQGKRDAQRAVAGVNADLEATPRGKQPHQQRHELALFRCDLHPRHAVHGGLLAQPLQHFRFAQRDR